MWLGSVRAMPPHQSFCGGKCPLPLVLPPMPIWPPWTMFSVKLYASSILYLYADTALFAPLSQKHGLKVYLRNPTSFTPIVSTKDFLLLGNDMRANKKQIAKFSIRDAEVCVKPHTRYVMYGSFLCSWFFHLCCHHPCMLARFDHLVPDTCRE